MSYLSSIMVATVLRNPLSTFAATIPYRTEAAVSATSLVSALFVVAMVLVLLLVAAFYARRRGWLSALGLPQATRPDLHEGIAVHATRRVSSTTMAHVIAYRGQEYLVVESRRGFATSVTSLTSASHATDSET